MIVATIILINVVVVSRWLWMLDVLDNNNGSIICILSGNCLKEYVYCRVCYTQERAGMMPGECREEEDKGGLLALCG